MYESDPFTAHRQRQEQFASKKAAFEASTSDSIIQPRVSKEFINAPEVKMAAPLRDTVEDVIRKVCLYKFFSNQVYLIVDLPDIGTLS